MARAIEQRLSEAYEGAVWHTKDEGPIDAPVIVMMHGWGSRLDHFDGLAGAVKDQYRVIRFDLPGHGQTPPPSGGLSIPDAGTAIEAQLLARGVTRCVWVGHSNGGRLGLYLASRSLAETAEATAHRVSIDALLLLAPSGMKPRRAPSYYLKRAIAIGLKTPLRLLPMPLRTGAEEALRYTLPWRLISSSDYSILSPNMRHMFVQMVNWYVEDKLASIVCPTVILRGDRDTAVGAWELERLAQGIADGGYVTVAEAGHYLQLDQPQVVLSSLLHLMTSVNTAGPEPSMEVA